MKTFLRGFVYAFKGIKVAIQQERNFRFHLCVGFFVYIFSLFYPFGRMEYVVITILIAGVLALELVNSALERAVYQPSPEHFTIAGIVKDMAAAAVLVQCIAAAVCGVAFFGDIQIIRQIADWFIHRPLMLVFLVGFLLLSGWFIFCFGASQKKQKGK